METLLNEHEEERNPSRLFHQAIWFFTHSALALGSWITLMLLGYAFNPQGVSQFLILFFSMLIPSLAGYAFTRSHQDEMASLVWLVGLIWMLIISLWILDMPTGPNACFQ
jgi:hypothetical protein